MNRIVCVLALVALLPGCAAIGSMPRMRQRSLSEARARPSSSRDTVPPLSASH